MVNLNLNTNVDAVFNRMFGLHKSNRVNGLSVFFLVLVLLSFSVLVLVSIYFLATQTNIFVGALSNVYTGIIIVLCQASSPTSTISNLVESFHPLN